jgi:hypothetical protein
MVNTREMIAARTSVTVATPETIPLAPSTPALSSAFA